MQDDIHEFKLSVNSLSGDDLIEKVAYLVENRNKLAVQPKGSYSQNYVIFRHRYPYKYVHIGRFSFNIRTIIGTFRVSFGTATFRYGFYANVGINNYRDLYTHFDFTTNFGFQFRFGINIAIKKVGVYCNGWLVNKRIEAGYRAINFSPMKLTDEIAKLDEFKNRNILTLYRYLYQTNYYVKIEFGIYHAWRLLRMRRFYVKRCWKILWRRRCIGFHLWKPQFYWRERRYGWSLPSLYSSRKML